MSPIAPAGSVSATYIGPALSETMSQAAPVLCINTPTSETTSATRRFRKVGVRNGRQRLGISGDLGMFCSGLGLPCFTDDEDQHLQVKICSCPWSLINDYDVLFSRRCLYLKESPCRRQESSTGFPIRTNHQSPRHRITRSEYSGCFATCSCTDGQIMSTLSGPSAEPFLPERKRAPYHAIF